MVKHIGKQQLETWLNTLANNNLKQKIGIV